MEVWRDIKGYEGLYQVSNEGKVRSIDRVIISGDGKARHYTTKLLSQSLNDKGYYAICLPKGNKKTVHRLMAETFLEVPEELKQYIGTNMLHVNHKDENKLNNKIDNLEWCSLPYNVNYGTARARMAETKRKNVYKYVDGELVGEYESLKEAAEKNNRNESTISYYIKKGTIDKRNNCLWTYNKKETE